MAHDDSVVKWTKLYFIREFEMFTKTIDIFIAIQSDSNIQCLHGSIRVQYSAYNYNPQLKCRVSVHDILHEHNIHHTY